MRIAVDAMGGDHAPHEIVKGAVAGARLHKVGIQLVGLPDAIQKELDALDTSGLDIQIVPALEVIEMGESPATALRKKRNASIVVTAKCVHKGESQGMVAAGSTGAAMASALFNIGRIDGIDRPAIGVVLPSTGNNCILIDAGANSDCIPEMLLQFGRMGSVLMHNVYNIPNPRVGILTIGEELGKGNSFVNAAYKLLEHDTTLNFIGNVEGRDMFLGNVEVAVCDGFTGNVALKAAEGVGKMLKILLKQELSKSFISQSIALLAKPVISKVMNQVDAEEFGGALLLGVKGICVISHGGSHARGIQNAVRVAKEAIETDVLGKIGTRIVEGCGTVT
ncbi:MAG: phosphate acyltransferase PlsX [Cyanobacteria bacterium]|nr:phosphate acyltransferase PlsX [Cyanobacteriota bacterium]